MTPPNATLQRMIWVNCPGFVMPSFHHPHQTPTKLCAALTNPSLHLVGWGCLKKGGRGRVRFYREAIKLNSLPLVLHVVLPSSAPHLPTPLHPSYPPQKAASDPAPVLRYDGPYCTRACMYMFRACLGEPTGRGQRRQPREGVACHDTHDALPTASARTLDMRAKCPWVREGGD